ncbi:MAG: hypothetical protein DMG04_21150 [Acidobacteria bacterium]|nr:MAG: hypothetical protein DMG04_21150 [Acidobacteriota bacterium]PYQ87301.1 MAG: hypothetical protein DMG03_05785 [Acidobacteriota bacterium]
MSPSSRSWLTIIGRLQSGQTVESAGAGLKAVEPQIRQATIPPNFPKQFADQYLAGREGFIAVPAATGKSAEISGDFTKAEAERIANGMSIR